MFVVSASIDFLQPTTFAVAIAIPDRYCARSPLGATALRPNLLVAFTATLGVWAGAGALAARISARY